MPPLEIKCISEQHDEVVISVGKDVVFFAASGAPIALNGEAEASVGALLAMKLGTSMVLDRPVSSTYCKGLQLIGAIFHQWFGFAPTPGLSAPLPMHANAQPGTRVGSFFSGGADSFFTLLQHEEEITDLILVIGMDIPLSDCRQAAVTEAAAREVATAFGKNLVVVHTNLRAGIERASLDWGTQAHGSAMATVGHLLATEFRKIYVASSHTYQGLFPWGSHPVVDHHWSSDRLQFKHDGCEATRVQKIKLIADTPVALSALRVCWMSSGGIYNCGVCSKCVRTMISLEAVGALKRATSFPTKLSPRVVARLKLHKPNDMLFAAENIAALQESGASPEILKALQTALKRSQLRARLTALVALFPRCDQFLRKAHMRFKPTPKSPEDVAAAFNGPSGTPAIKRAIKRPE